MKKTILLWALSLLFIHGDDITIIDRTGFHMGIGGTAVVVKEIPIVIPMFDLSFEYGLTPQSTLLLEHHGYLIGGLMALAYKYYMIKDEVDTFYLLVGAVGMYAIDYGQRLPRMSLKEE